MNIKEIFERQPAGAIEGAGAVPWSSDPAGSRGGGLRAGTLGALVRETRFIHCEPSAFPLHADRCGLKGLTFRP